MESEYQHSSGLHRKPPVFYTQHAYTIFGEKYSRPFLCSPCPAQNDNPKSRSLFALKSQIAEFKEAKLTMPKNVLGHSIGNLGSVYLQSQEEITKHSLSPFPVSMLHWSSTGSAVNGRIRLILILLTVTLPIVLSYGRTMQRWWF